MAKAKVLIIDDNPANLFAMEALLSTYVDDEGEGIEILQADSGKSSLDVLLANKVDLILLDVQMPEMDGYETARLIGMSQKTKTIPIIFLSAVHKDEMHISRGYQGGAIDFISKPFHPEILKAKIGNFLRIQRAILRAMEAEKEKAAILDAAKLKSQFLMNINHELRTPMNGVLGIADLMLAFPALGADQRECIEMIRKSGQHMLRLVDDILDIASLQANQITLQNQPFFLNRVVDEIIDLYRYQIDMKRLSFEVMIDPILEQRLLGDERRIKQAIINLLSNAIKFTDRGRISLTVSAQEKSESEIEAEIKIQDTGVGIASREALFQIFSPGDDSGKKKYAGTGLGLAITKHLVALMGGSLKWQSEPGVGSVFTLAVPFIKCTNLARTA